MHPSSTFSPSASSMNHYSSNAHHHAAMMNNSNLPSTVTTSQYRSGFPHQHQQLSSAPSVGGHPHSHNSTNNTGSFYRADSSTFPHHGHLNTNGHSGNPSTLHHTTSNPGLNGARLAMPAVSPFMATLPPQPTITSSQQHHPSSAANQRGSPVGNHPASPSMFGSNSQHHPHTSGITSASANGLIGGLPTMGNSGFPTHANNMGTNTATLHSTRSHGGTNGTAPGTNNNGSSSNPQIDQNTLARLLQAANMNGANLQGPAPQFLPPLNGLPPMHGGLNNGVSNAHFGDSMHFGRNNNIGISSPLGFNSNSPHNLLMPGDNAPTFNSYYAGQGNMGGQYHPSSTMRGGAPVRRKRQFNPFHSKTVPRTQDHGITAQNNTKNKKDNANNITTVMVRNLPNKYTHSTFQAELNEDLGLKGLYDFLYIPMDVVNKSNVGYCFINFVDAEACKKAKSVFGERYDFKRLPSLRKTGEITDAHVQGFWSNLDILKNKTVVSAKKQEYRPVVLWKGEFRVKDWHKILLGHMSSAEECATMLQITVMEQIYPNNSTISNAFGHMPVGFDNFGLQHQQQARMLEPEQHAVIAEELYESCRGFFNLEGDSLIPVTKLESKRVRKERNAQLMREKQMMMAAMEQQQNNGSAGSSSEGGLNSPVGGNATSTFQEGNEFTLMACNIPAVVTSTANIMNSAGSKNIHITSSPSNHSLSSEQKSENSDILHGVSSKSHFVDEEGKRLIGATNSAERGFSASFPLNGLDSEDPVGVVNNNGHVENNSNTFFAMKGHAASMAAGITAQGNKTNPNLNTLL